MSDILDEIKAAFSDTMFWNNSELWTGDAVNDNEYPLRIIDPAPPAYRESLFGEGSILLRFESGDLSIDAVAFPKQGEDADGENVTSESDAAFVANLPIFVPAMLREIDAMREAISTLSRALAGQPTEPLADAEAEKVRKGIEALRAAAKAFDAALSDDCDCSERAELRRALAALSSTDGGAK